MADANPDRNARILAAVDRPGQTLAEIGREFGISPQRVAAIAVRERQRREWLAAVIAERARPLLDRRVAYLPLSTRTRHYLSECHWHAWPGSHFPALETVRDVLDVPVSELLRRPNIGAASIIEFHDVIRAEGERSA